MNSTELLKYKQMLTALRSDLREEIRRTGEAIPEQTHPPGEHEIAPSEGIDTEIAMERSAQEILRQVNEALARVDAGTFGKCQACGGPIAEARLDSVPYVPLCVDCERQRELG